MNYEKYGNNQVLKKKIFYPEAYCLKKPELI